MDAQWQSERTGMRDKLERMQKVRPPPSPIPHYRPSSPLTSPPKPPTSSLSLLHTASLAEWD